MIDQVTEVPDDAAEPAPPAAPTKWTFVRAADGRIGGVCQSLAVATGLDVTLVRLAMIGAALWGPGLVAYIALLVAVPRADTADDPRVAPAPEDVAKWLRVALAVAGALGVASVVGGIGWADWPLGSFYRDGGAFGITLIAVAIAVVVLRRRQGDDDTAAPAPPAVGDPANDAAAAASPVMGPASDAMPEAVTDARPSTAVAVDAPSPPASNTAPLPVVGPLAAGAPAFTDADRPVTDADANRTALLLTRITGWLIVLAALAAATAVVAAVRLGVLEVRLPGLVWTLAIAALVAACVALVRARSIAIISGALVVLVVAWGIGAAATRFAGPTGTRTVAVADVSELADRYEHAAGWLTLDLSALSLDGGEATVEVDVRAGRADIVVPDDVAVDIRSEVLAGESQLLGQTSDGWSVTDRVRDTPPAATGTLVVDLEVGAGSGRVCRAAQADADRHCSN